MASIAGSWRGASRSEGAPGGSEGEFVRQGARLGALLERGRGRGAGVDAELCALLDDLNAINYYSAVLTEPVRVAIFGCLGG